MAFVEHDHPFRERLISAYRAGDLGAADFMICSVADWPALFLTTRERCLGLLHCLELWAAVFARPHYSLAEVAVDRWQWPRQRPSGTSAQAVRALFWLSQSPFGAEFAEDTLHLRPRLFALAQAEAKEARAAATNSSAA